MAFLRHPGRYRYKRLASNDEEAQAVGRHSGTTGASISSAVVALHGFNGPIFVPMGWGVELCRREVGTEVGAVGLADFGFI